MRTENKENNPIYLDIRGFLPISLVDMKDRIVSTVFLGGCHYRCPYCYNSQLRNFRKKEDYDNREWSFILDKIAENKHMIDGVVFTGGEPLLQKDLPRAILEIKRENLEVYIHTSLPNPKMLKKIVDLVDFFVIDAKGPEDKHHLITGKNISWKSFQDSVLFLKSKRKKFSVHLIHDKNILSDDDVSRLENYLKKELDINLEVKKQIKNI